MTSGLRLSARAALLRRGHSTNEHWRSTRKCSVQNIPQRHGACTTFLYCFCAKVILPNGLEIADIGIFSKDGRTWSQMPAQQVRDGEGRPITDGRGKSRYVSSIKWSTRELQDGFSEALIALVLAEHPGAIPGGNS